MLSILCHLHSHLPCTVERREGSRFGFALVIFRAVPLWNYLLTVNSDFCGKKITKPAAYSSGIFPGNGQKSRVMKQTICSIQKTFLISAYFSFPLRGRVAAMKTLQRTQVLQDWWGWNTLLSDNSCRSSWLDFLFFKRRLDSLTYAHN